jgi:hypothetical protein
MYFGNACLFNKKPEDMRRIGALGGRARARNLRRREAQPAAVAREISPPHDETAAEAIRRIDALCPWLVGAERRDGPQRACRRWHTRG